MNLELFLTGAGCFYGGSRRPTTKAPHNIACRVAVGVVPRAPSEVCGCRNSPLRSSHRMQRTRAYKWRLPVTVKCHEDTMTDTQRHYDQKRQRQIFPFPFFFFDLVLCCTSSALQPCTVIMQGFDVTLANTCNVYSGFAAHISRIPFPNVDNYQSHHLQRSACGA